MPKDTPKPKAQWISALGIGTTSDPKFISLYPSPTVPFQLLLDHPFPHSPPKRHYPVSCGFSTH